MNVIWNHKLIVTIVKKGWSRKIVKASKQAGAKGGTVLFGKGTSIHKTKPLLGVVVEPDREVILTLVKSELLEQISSVIEKEGNLDKPRHGMGFVIDINRVAGMCHMKSEESSSQNGKGAMKNMIAYDLIVTIVNKGVSEEVVEASKKAGAEGGTILFGRGTGIHEQAKLFNITIEPEKDIVLTLIDRKKTDEVLEAIAVDAKLNQPGRGIAFVLDVERTIGINHILNQIINEKLDQEE